MYLTHGLHRIDQQEPDRICTIFRGRRQTYGQFTHRVARLAAVLQALGMQRGDRVGMLALNSDRYLEYVMAVWWGGGVINPVNIRWSISEIVYSLDDCETHILLVDDAHLHMVGGIVAKAARAPTLLHVGDTATPQGMIHCEAQMAAASPAEDVFRGGADLAAILYTGGTTGFPKGVMLSHLNLYSSAVQRLADVPRIPNSVVLHTAPFFHGAALSRAITQFTSGESHVILPGFDVPEVLATIEREKVSELLLVPTMIQAVVMHPDFHKHDLGSLRRMIYGASPISPELQTRIAQALPQVELLHGYGLTEACPSVSVNLPENHRGEALKNGLYRSAGRSCIGVQVKIVDEQGKEVPRNTVGEIVVRAANVMQGYWNKPEETAKALRDGWLHTGDGAYMDEAGYLFVVDRLKDMIVSGGENVYSAEVENALSRHPAVLYVAVIGIPHEKWGEAVHAEVVLRPGMTASQEELIAHCREMIAGYKCPKSVAFRESMPLSGAGKILKRTLREAYWKNQNRSIH